MESGDPDGYYIDKEDFVYLLHEKLHVVQKNI